MEEIKKELKAIKDIDGSDMYWMTRKKNNTATLSPIGVTFYVDNKITKDGIGEAERLIQHVLNTKEFKSMIKKHNAVYEIERAYKTGKPYINKEGKNAYGKSLQIRLRIIF